MRDSVGSVTQAQPVPPMVDAREQARDQRLHPVPTDKVELSSQARTALQEAKQTPAQATEEPDTGDMLAKQLLAKQDEAKQAATAQENAKSATHVVA
jgi:hypothetical protein